MSDFDDDERSVDSKSEGSLCEFIINSSDDDGCGEDDAAITNLTKISTENICKGKRTRRKNNRFVPENYAEMMLESCSDIGTETEEEENFTEEDDETWEDCDTFSGSDD